MAEKSVMKGLLVLETLARSGYPLGVAELSSKLGLTKSNVHRLLTALVEAGFARRRVDMPKYELTLKLWEFRRLHASGLESWDVVGQDLAELARRTGETVYMSVLDGVETVFIHQIESRHSIQAKVSERQPAFASSTGKAILAFQPEETIRQVMRTLRPLTRSTITTTARFFAELEGVRKRGFAINLGEARQTTHGVAAAIRNAVGEVVSAVGVSGPADRLPLKKLEEYGQEVARTAGRLSEKLGLRSSAQAQMGQRPKLSKEASK